MPLLMFLCKIVYVAKESFRLVISLELNDVPGGMSDFLP